MTTMTRRKKTKIGRSLRPIPTRLRTSTRLYVHSSLLGRSRRSYSTARLRRGLTSLGTGRDSIRRSSSGVRVAAFVTIRTLAMLLKVIARQVLIVLAARARTSVPLVALAARAALIATTTR
jgi:hypothetical protein